MSRIINHDSARRERSRLTRSLVIAIRELAKQTEPGEESRDLSAFIALALDVIAKTIDTSVIAWEKRGYWVKADKFRMEWAWSGHYAVKMKHLVHEEDWESIALNVAQIAQKLSKVTVPIRNRLGKPWKGAWEELQKQQW